MNNLPPVSIALATYNGEPYLVQQMDSLLAQDYPNLEIVVSDDCSTDGTWKILQNYAARDSRIQLLPREQNLGYVGNFYRAFLACGGDLISPSDQDDIWYSNKTSRLVENIGGAQLVYCNSRHITLGGQPTGKTHTDIFPPIHGDDPRKFLFSTSVCGHAMLFNRKLLNVHGRITKTPYIDWWIAFVAANIGHINYLDEVLVDYRQNPASVGRSFKKNKKSIQRLHYLRIEAARLDTFAEFPGKQQAYCEEVKKAWQAWYSSYFDFRMFLIALRDAPIIHYALCKESSRRQFAMKYLVGHKLKHLILPNQYPVF